MLKKTILYILFIIVSYAFLVANLYKMTGELELNIFKAKGWYDLIITTIIATPFVIIIIKMLKNKKK